MFNFKIVNKDDYETDQNMLETLKKLSVEQKKLMGIQEQLIKEYADRYDVAQSLIKQQNNYINYLKKLVEELKAEKESE